MLTPGNGRALRALNVSGHPSSKSALTEFEPSPSETKAMSNSTSLSETSEETDESSEANVDVSLVVDILVVDAKIWFAK